MPDRVRLTVPSEERALVLAVELARRYGETHEIPGDDTERLAGLVQGLVRFSLERGYPDDPTGQIELTLDVSNGAVNVDVHDWGRPLTTADAGSGTLPAELRALAPTAENLRLVNLGADGKRLSGRVRVSHVLDTGLEANDFGAPPRAPAGDGLAEHVDVRPAVPADAEAISQLLYDNYHLSYGHPDFYRPSWVGAELASGRLRSSVAIHGAGVIGHHALLPHEGTASAETGVAVVHPAFRGLGIFGRLFERTLHTAAELALEAVWGRGVTVHPYSQRSERSHGYRESALMLASVPAATTMAGLAEEGGNRAASLLSYRLLQPRPRAVFLPGIYESQLRDAYENLDLEVRGTRSPASPPDGDPVSWHVEDERQTGWMRVTGWDEAVHGHASHATMALLGHHVDVVYADLDLRTIPEIDAAVAALNHHGFSYAGLVASGRDGHDFLRLQLPSCENVEIDGIVCDSPFAQTLLSDVLADRARVDAG